MTEKIIGEIAFVPKIPEVSVCVISVTERGSFVQQVGLSACFPFLPFQLPFSNSHWNGAMHGSCGFDSEENLLPSVQRGGNVPEPPVCTPGQIFPSTNHLKMGQMMILDAWIVTPTQKVFKKKRHVSGEGGR